MKNMHYFFFVHIRLGHGTSLWQYPAAYAGMAKCNRHTLCFFSFFVFVAYILFQTHMKCTTDLFLDPRRSSQPRLPATRSTSWDSTTAACALTRLHQISRAWIHAHQHASYCVRTSDAVRRRRGQDGSKGNDNNVISVHENEGVLIRIIMVVSIHTLTCVDRSIDRSVCCMFVNHRHNSHSRMYHSHSRMYQKTLGERKIECNHQSSACAFIRHEFAPS